MKRLWLSALIATLALAPLSVRAHAGEPAPLQGFDAYVRHAMTVWRVPGLAIAVVDNDHVIMEKGFGVRTVGSPEKVDVHTLFGIASDSKAFTTVALGILKDRGELDWDDRVTRFLPGFQLYEPYPSREVTIRDLLTHQTGDCGADFLWYGSSNTRAEIIHKLRLLKPRYGFRRRYCYSNNLVMVAGQIIPAITGIQWGGFVEQNIFKPLDMTESNTSITEFKPGGDIATPHADVGGKIAPIHWANVDNIGPAASINSNVDDMAHWIEMLLNDGTYNGRRVVSGEVIHEMESPQVVLPSSVKNGGDEIINSFPPALSPAYGLTLRTEDFRGVRIDWHAGAIDGMGSVVGLIPARHLGVVILANKDDTNLPIALMDVIFNDYIGPPHIDWGARLLALMAKEQTDERKSEAEHEIPRQPHPEPSLPLGDYAGTYSDPLYGQASVSLADGHLMLTRGSEFVGDLEPWNHDTFRVTWRYHFLGQDFVQFGLSPAGSADALYFLRGEGYPAQMTLHRDTKRPNTARVSSTRGSH
ncbi:MAG TPA: serine hydrolase [Steroidobacteraceae bacterium]|nr:serine hydrolase [Steroidobacteraceae bacterium]